MASDLIPRTMLHWPTLPSLLEDDALWGSGGTGLSVWEDDKHVFVEAAVPGLEPKDIDVTYKDGSLWIKGQRAGEENKKRYYRKAATLFSYQLTVPGNADPGKEPEARVQNGLLTLVFPKAKQAEPKKIAVKRG